jgi:hypothetical protein
VFRLSVDFASWEASYILFIYSLSDTCSRVQVERQGDDMKGALVFALFVVLMLLSDDNAFAEGSGRNMEAEIK